MRNGLLALLFSFSLFQLLGQGSFTLSGNVNDKTKAIPVEGAALSLLQATDSLLVKTAISETDGTYQFEQLAGGNYLLLLTLEGYRDTILPAFTLSGDLQLPATDLVPVAGSSLETFSVVARVPIIQHKIDRTIVNVDAMISAAGNTVLELLGKSPGIIVTQNGDIMLKGKSGALVYIDDKPTYLSGDQLINYLRSMPASSISQIEIMTNPPARYDAAGSVGIINLITKKSKLKGFNGSFSVGYGQGRYWKSHNSFLFNYRNNKVNVFGSVSGGVSNFFSDLGIKRIYRNEDLSVASTFDQTIKTKLRENYGNAKLGMDFYATEKTTLGFSANTMLATSENNSRNISVFTNPEGAMTSQVIADNGRYNKFVNGGLNLNMRHKYDSTGRMLTMDADYIRYGTYSDADYLYNTYDPAGTLTENERLEGTLPAIIDIVAFKTDYTHPFEQDSKLEAGFKSSYTSIDNRVDYFTTINSVTTPDYDKTNHFKYNEMINAAYVNFNKTIKRFAFQTGLRAEGTTSIGNQLGNAVKPSSRFKRDYLNLFPTAFVSYYLDSASTQQLVLSYGRRINRPYYQDMNPFVEPLDKFTFYTGNTLLKPMFSHDVTMTYNFKSLFSAAFSYNTYRNEIAETIMITPEQLYYSMPGNIGQSQNINFSVSATIPVKKWLVTTIYTEVANLQYKSQLFTETLNSKGNYFYVNMNNSFVFKKGWTAELSGFYMTRQTSAQFTLMQRGQINIGASKKILKEKGSIRFSLSDVFWSHVNQGIINNLRLTDATYKSKWDNRVMFLTFSYSFGKPFVSEERHEGNGSASEQQRVKN